MRAPALAKLHEIFLGQSGGPFELVARSKEQSAIYQLEPITSRLLLQLIDGPIPVLIRHQWIFL